MPAKHTLHVAVTAPLLEFVGREVATGRHATASSVVRAGLELLLERAGAHEAPPETTGPEEAVRRG